MTKSLHGSLVLNIRAGRLQISSRGLQDIPEAVYTALSTRGSLYSPKTVTAGSMRASFASTTSPVDDGDSPKWWEVCDLRSMKAASNELSKVDERIASLESLELLDLHSNRIEDPLPASFGTLVNLTSLNLANNRLSAWPIELLALVHLKELDLSSNHLTTFWPCSWRSDLRERMLTVKRRHPLQRDATGPDTSFDSFATESSVDRSEGVDFCK